MQGDRKQVKIYLADWGGWESCPIGFVDYPSEVLKIVNIYTTFSEPDIRRVVRSAGGQLDDADDGVYQARLREYRASHYITNNSTVSRKKPELPWYDQHLKMNILHQIIVGLNDIEKYLVYDRFKHKLLTDAIAEKRNRSAKTLEERYSKIYDVISSKIRTHAQYHDLFCELYKIDRQHKPFNLSDVIRKRAAERKREQQKLTRYPTLHASRETGK